MKIYVNGEMVTFEEKLRNATVKLRKFWNTPLRGFWMSVYTRYRDEFYEQRQKAGKHEEAHIPAPDNHDGKPAA